MSHREKYQHQQLPPSPQPSRFILDSFLLRRSLAHGSCYSFFQGLNKLGSTHFWFYVKMAFELSNANNSSSNLNSTLKEVFEINLSNVN